MLTEKEKHGISELLDRMSTGDLASLAQTVTSRLIVPETEAEAISAIILRTERPADLLRRRKIKKEFLFKYLRAKRVAIEASTDKSGVICAVLQLWGGGASSSSFLERLEEDSLPEAPAPSRNTSYSSLCSLDSNSSPSHVGSFLLRSVIGRLPVNCDNEQPSWHGARRRSESPLSMTQMDDEEEEDGGIDIGVHIDEDDYRFPSPSSSCHTRPSQSLTPTPPFPPSLSSSCKSTPVALPPSALLLSSSAPSSYDSFFNGGSVASSVSPASSSGSPTAASSFEHNNEAHEMADSFVRWFYELLNSTFYCRCGDGQVSEFGPQHFWTDASASINLQKSSPFPFKDSSSAFVESIRVQSDGKRVCDALRHVVQKYRVTYNPNLTREGVSGHLDAHGSATVTACGTLHSPSSSTACGTFHQQFGLVRDPALGNNWKIKFTNANLVSKDSAVEIPNLDGLLTASSAIPLS